LTNYRFAIAENLL